jgi:hypothetical protein
MLTRLGVRLRRRVRCGVIANVERVAAADHDRWQSLAASQRQRNEEERGSHGATASAGAMKVT